MAEKKPTAEKPETQAPAADTSQPTEYLQEAPKVDEVTLYNREGKQRKLTDPAAIVRAEFSGWSRNKDHFKPKKKK